MAARRKSLGYLFWLIIWFSLISTDFKCLNPLSRLYDDLMSGLAPTTIAPISLIKSAEAYNSLVKPTGLGLGGKNSLDENGALFISSKMSFKQIVSFDEKNQILTTSANFYLTWYDARLSWNPNNYSGITGIQVPASKFWSPDISIMNAAGSASLVRIDSNQYVGISYTGFTSLSLSLPSLQTRCALDVKKYPFDTQKCSIIVGSWMYTTKDVTFEFYKYFNLSESYYDLSNYIQHPYWDLKSVTARFVFDSTRYLQVNRLNEFFSLLGSGTSFEAKDLSFDLVLARKPLYVMINSIYINFVLNIVILLAFYMPFTVQMSVCKYNIFSKLNRKNYKT
jgi:hypothetical protein